MAAEQTPADGYYGDDDFDSNEELDLSFLDEDEKGTDKDQKDAK